jgi:hypothetical protein
MIKELKSAYYVKYKVPKWLSIDTKFEEGSIRYGVISAFEDSSKEEWNRGNVIVCDAITPASFILPNDENVNEISKEPVDPKNPWKNEFDLYVEKDLEIAENAQESLKPGIVKGRIITVQVGDGYAYYIVTKVNKTTCTLEWRGWSPDRWKSQLFGFGGSYRISDVKKFYREPIKGLGGW